MTTTNYNEILLQGNTPPNTASGVFEKVLFRRNVVSSVAQTDADPVEVGYRVGDTIYSDRMLMVEVPAADIQKAGTQIVDEVAIALTAAGEKGGNISMDYAESITSVQGVDSHPGGGVFLGYQLEIAATAAAPTDADYALHDAELGRQAFSSDTTHVEQITIVLPSAYNWLRGVRSDGAADGLGAANINGHFRIIRGIA